MEVWKTGESLRDNTEYSHIPHEIISELKPVLNCKIKNLEQENKDSFWIFPEKDNRYGDKLEDEQIFTYQDKKLRTCNVLGHLGIGDTDISIRSRFCDGKEDWFMQYLLSKVLSINIFNLNHGKGVSNDIDYTKLLFPYYLKRAYKQGIFREYTTRHYNNSHLRGSIDLSRHIKENYPFKNGKIAYHTREYTTDNNVTELIRHTIEFIKKTDEDSYRLICQDKQTKRIINEIISLTPSFDKGEIKDIIVQNTGIKRHSFYTEYYPLQKLCIDILKQRKTGYGHNSKKIHGVLFDGAWLWEEYLDTILSEADFIHLHNKKHSKDEHPLHIIINRKNKYKRYPDFLKPGIIADAKYKKLFTLNKNGIITDDINREDFHQMITYLYVTKSMSGVYITPYASIAPNVNIEPSETDFGFVESTNDYYVYKVGKLEGYGGLIKILGLRIPTNCTTYDDFVNKMRKIEESALKACLSL